MKYSHIVIDELLRKFTPVLKNDREKYSNHVYRVFLHCSLLDAQKENEEKYAVAAVFHDIGIWTDGTIDYLVPSIQQAVLFLKETGREDWIEEISAMIYWHHKTKKYRGAFEQTVETFRRADWMDVSLGILQYGADTARMKEGRTAFPNKGFHFFLAGKIISNWFRHPLHPLPMFKK